MELKRREVPPYDDSLLEIETIPLERKNAPEKLDKWSAAFTSFLATAERNLIKEQTRAAQLLQIQHLARYIHLSVAASDEATSNDKFLPGFQKIVSLCSALLMSSDKPSTPKHPRPKKYLYEHGVIPSLYLVGYKFRDPIVRREAHGLLACIRRKEGVWESDLMAKVVEHIIAVEEIDRVVCTSADIPNEARVWREHIHAGDSGKYESKAGVWYYGSSYGTVLGATFASLFPMNVGRCILDGVVDAQNYYEGRWDANLFDTDTVFLKFPKYCYERGREKCSFWGPSEQNVTDRIDNLLTKIKQQPIAVAGIQQNGTTTGLATYSDLKQTMLLASYFPLEEFPVLAAALTGLESSNGSIIATISETYLWGADPATLIKCIDSYGNYNTTSIDDFQDWVNIQRGQSKLLGDTWSTNAAPVLCRSLELNLSRRGSFSGFLPPSSNHTSPPLLFLSNTSDPASPIRGAFKMSRAFAGSAVLVREGIGHTVGWNGGSLCVFEKVQAYLQDGKVPPTNTTCQDAPVPFGGS